MMIEKFYYCDTCRRKLELKANSRIEFFNGYAIRWVGPGGGAHPSSEDELQEWQAEDSPIHLCAICIAAIGKFAIEKDELKGT